jgi:hypothetical protein
MAVGNTPNVTADRLRAEDPTTEVSALAGLTSNNRKNEISTNGEILARLPPLNIHWIRGNRTPKGA